MKLKTIFQDEDFELGEIVDADIATMPDGRLKLQAKAMRGGLHTFFYESKDEFDNNWGSVLPRYYYITEYGPIEYDEIFEEDKEVIDSRKSIGNYFETEEEAELAVRKLQAYKRLKDKGFKFNGWIREHKNGSSDITIASFIDEDYDITNDLDLLFGGEE